MGAHILEVLGRIYMYTLILSMQPMCYSTHDSPIEWEIHCMLVMLTHTLNFSH